ncbi:hypothetical protein Avbf_14703 [Armadillidium vulgare]|nr:hypothetical protein Avbf_14703 [Armadillidium vulgare]
MQILSKNMFLQTLYSYFLLKLWRIIHSHSFEILKLYSILILIISTINYKPKLSNSTAQKQHSRLLRLHFQNLPQL